MFGGVVIGEFGSDTAGVFGVSTSPATTLVARLRGNRTAPTLPRDAHALPRGASGHHNGCLSNPYAVGMSQRAPCASVVARDERPQGASRLGRFVGGAVGWKGRACRTCLVGSVTTIGRSLRSPPICHGDSGRATLSQAAGGATAGKTAIRPGISSRK
jgi:hypothetical protein